MITGEPASAENNNCLARNRPIGSASPEENDMPSAEEINRAKQIVCAIIELGGGKFAGKTRLSKAFYAAHVIHLKNKEGVLSNYPIVHLPHGPAIDDGDHLLHQLMRDGIIDIAQQRNGPFTEHVYSLKGDVDELPGDCLESIKEAVDWVANRTAAELTAMTHDESRSWLVTKDGQRMDLYLDAIEDEEYEEIVARQKKIRESINAAFSRDDA